LEITVNETNGMAITSGDDPSRPKSRTVDIVIPVYNEEVALPRCVATLREYLETTCPYVWSITLANNASRDGTPAVAEALASEDPRVRTFSLAEKGRGRALRTAWLASEADIVAYMDVDLSTDLESFLPLVEPLAQGEADVAIGSRLRDGARVTRSLKRESISRAYNLLLKTAFGSGFSDAQCGFKALRRDVALTLLPEVENQEWFFDTELLLLAEAKGFRLHEVPVAWVEDRDSRVKIIPAVLEDLKGMWRVRSGRVHSGRFAPKPDRRELEPASRTAAGSDPG